MHIVAIHDWPTDVSAAAAAIASTLGILIFEARQKIAAGGPVVLKSFADPQQAAGVAARLAEQGVPALVVDSQALREHTSPHAVARFILGEQGLQLALVSGESHLIGYDSIDLLLVASCSLGQTLTSDGVNKRKFSLGKTLLAGGIPMTKKVRGEATHVTADRDQTLWLYTADQQTWIFDRAVLDYTGLGAALQLSRELNFNYLKKEVRRLAPQANYDERLLRRGDLSRLLGPLLNPETDLDLAFEILARSLLVLRAGDAALPDS